MQTPVRGAAARAGEHSRVGIVAGGGGEGGEVRVFERLGGWAEEVGKRLVEGWELRI